MTQCCHHTQKKKQGKIGTYWFQSVTMKGYHRKGIITMMEVHTIQADDKLMICGIVDKKRKDFNGNNIACVRIYDTTTDEEGHYKNECSIMNIEKARQGWDEFVSRANKGNYSISTQQSIYKTMDGSSILTDSEIHEAMDDICRKQLWRMKNPQSNKVDEPTTGKGELGIVPKGTKHITMEDEAPYLDNIAKMLEKQFPLKTESTPQDGEIGTTTQEILDALKDITEDYKGVKQ